MDGLKRFLAVFGLFAAIMALSTDQVHSAEIDLTTRELAAQIADILYQQRQPAISNNGLGPLLTSLLNAGGEGSANRLAAALTKGLFSGTQPLFMPITVLASPDFTSRFFCDKDKDKKKDKPKPETTTEAHHEEEEVEEEEGYIIYEHKPSTEHYSTTTAKPKPTHHHYTTTTAHPTHSHYYSTPEHPPYHHYTSTALPTTTDKPVTTKKPVKKPLWWSLFAAPNSSIRVINKKLAKESTAIKNQPADITEDVNKESAPEEVNITDVTKSEQNKLETSVINSE